MPASGTRKRGLASPRFRRRLLWLGGALAAAGVVALVVVLVPSRSGPTRGSVANPVFTNVATVPVYRRPTATVVRAQNAAIRVTRPIAERYLTLRNRGRTLSGVSVAFAGRQLVGYVFAYTPSGGGVADATLYAIRLRKVGARWSVDYVHEGHGSAYVDENNYAPSGFLPGTYGRNFHAYLPVLLALAAFVALVVLAERRLARRRS